MITEFGYPTTYSDLRGSNAAASLKHRDRHTVRLQSKHLRGSNAAASLKPEQMRGQVGG